METPAGWQLVPVDLAVPEPSKVTESDRVAFGIVQHAATDWYLVTTDEYGNTMFIKEVGEGPSIKLSIPIESQYYKLYVEAVLGEDVKITDITLNSRP